MKNDPLLEVRRFLTQTLGYPADDGVVSAVDTALEQRDELMACLETYDGIDASEWWRNQRDAVLAKLKNND